MHFGTKHIYIYISFEGCRAVAWREGPGPGCFGAKSLGAGITSNKIADHPPMSFGFKKCPKYASEVKRLPKINMRASKVIRWRSERLNGALKKSE